MLKNRTYSKVCFGIKARNVVLNKVLDNNEFWSLNLFKKKFSLEKILIYLIEEKLSLINWIFFFLFNKPCLAEFKITFLIEK